MKKWIPVLFLLLFVLTVQAQEGPGEPLAIKKMTKELSASNSALQKEMARIKKKLNKLLKSKFRSLNPTQLDSLTAIQLPLASVDTVTSAITDIDIPDLDPDNLGLEGLTGKADSISGLLNTNQLSLEKYLELPIKADFLDSLTSLLPDTQLGVLDELQQKVADSTRLTPPNLDVAKELQVTITELDELKALYARVALPELNSPDLNNLLSDDMIPKGRFDKLIKEAGSFEEVLEKYTAEFENWDQKLLDRVTSLEEVARIQKMKDRIDNYEFLPEGYRKNMEGMQTNDFVKKKLEAKAEELKRVGAKSLQEKLDDAQTKMAEAKEKFPSLESVEEAPSRPPNPYKGEPFLKRIKVGGNFQANRQRPTSIDAALQVSYIINQNARVGTGFSYRIATQKRITNLDFDNQVLTSRAFFDYTFFRSLYAEALYESSSLEVVDQNDVSQGRQWVQSGMLGVGNRFSIAKKLQGSFTTLYNFLHDARSPYSSPWVFRVGFELK